MKGFPTPSGYEQIWGFVTYPAVVVGRQHCQVPPTTTAEVCCWRDAVTAPYRVLLETAAGQLRPFPADVDERVGRRIVERLRDRLVDVSLRTFVRELHQARAAGLLTAATSAGRFEEFALQSVGGSELAGILDRYPALGVLADRIAVQTVAAGREFLDRFAADRDTLVGTLLGGRDPGPLSDVAIVGDAHDGGRSPVLLTFADGARLVYKPRSLDLHAHFGELVGWLGRHTGLGLRVAEVLPRDGYGWSAFVDHRPCADNAGIGRFYRRQGALLALLYVLDGTDMHYENLVADGDHPVLVDVETLFHPTVRPSSLAGSDPAADVLKRSVVRTALLPTVAVGERGAFDYSGLGGDAGQLFPDDVVDWVDPGLDTMRLVRGPRRSTAMRNRPVLHDLPADAPAHRSALLNGFATAYDAIVRHRGELLGPDGLLARCATDEIRYVARPTRLYADLLAESTHPDALSDEQAREHLFGVLYENECEPRLVPYELADLRAGDVPLFRTLAGSRDVWSAGGDRLQQLLDGSGLEAAAAKILALDEIDKHRQEWLIAATFATLPRPGDPHRTTAVHPKPPMPAPADPQRVLSTASWIADQILATAISDGGRVNWLGLELVDDRQWTVLPMGGGLSNGFTGIAVFLAEIARLAGAERHRDLAREAVTPLPLLLDVLAGDIEALRIVGSGFNGLGGIRYALHRLAALLDDGEIRRWATVADALAEDLLAQTSEPVATFADGDAGGLAAALSSGSNRLARLYADRLATLVEEDLVPAGPGFATGRHGIAWALGRYGSSMPAVDSTTRVLDGPGWCSGSAGVLLADGVPDPDAYLRAETTRPALADLSLCHGELGALEPLIDLVLRQHPGADLVLGRRTGMVLSSIDQFSPRCGTPDGVTSPGLITGLAGIGHGLLRLAFPTVVPSVLRLEAASFPHR